MAREKKSLKSKIIKSSLAIGGVAVAGLVAVSCASHPPEDIGLADGKLRPPPSSPNCACSEYSDSKAYVKPFEFKGQAEDAWAALKAAVIAEGGTVEKEAKDYRWFTFTSRIFRFVDDVEFRLDRDGKVIHVRSASRVGRSDFGVNRKRVEAIRKRVTL
jgi:uncharacterized protein (DUF1499 family)